MFKLTFFLDKKPQELRKLIEPIGFRSNAKGELTWKREEFFFTLIPFSEKARGYDVCGYRAHFNTSPEGTIHLLKIFAPYHATYQGLEYSLNATRTKKEWINYFLKSNDFQVEDKRGIFRKNRIGIIVLGDDNVVLQVRPDRPKGTIPLAYALHDIQDMVEDIHPKKYDLFSMLEEQVI